MRTMLSGPMILRAPETDEGPDADLDLDEDFSLDEQDDQDDPGEDDQDEDLDDAEGDDQDEDEAPPPKSRGENRVAAATRIAKEAKDRADRLEREMADLRAAARPQTAPQETAEARQQRLANMEPWERSEFLRVEGEQRINNTLARIEFETKDTADKASYDALAARKPVAAKLRNEVEARLADMRKSGTTAPRETVLRWVIGDRALANEGKATGKARKSAAGRQERQAARPANGRGDTVSEGRRNGSTSARDKRLDTYQL